MEPQDPDKIGQAFNHIFSSINTIYKHVTEVSSPQLKVEISNVIGGLKDIFRDNNKVHERDIPGLIEYIDRIDIAVRREMVSSMHAINHQTELYANILVETCLMKNYAHEILFAFQYQSRIDAMNSLNSRIDFSNNDITEFGKSIEALKSNFPNLVNSVNEFHEKAKIDYEKFREYIDLNSEIARNITDIYTIEKVSEAFDERSVSESRIADFLRTSAIGVMTVVALIDLLYLYAGIFKPFDHMQASFVVGISFLLYVPALYLSKESSRHRSMQDINLRQSNDIKAAIQLITPLAKRERAKIISAISLMIISGKSGAESQSESPPFLTPEIINSIIGTVKEKSKQKD